MLQIKLKNVELERKIEKQEETIKRQELRIKSLEEMRDEDDRIKTQMDLIVTVDGGRSDREDIEKLEEISQQEIKGKLSSNIKSFLVKKTNKKIMKIKFHNKNDRDSIIKIKKKFRESGIFVNENLTRKNQDIFKAARLLKKENKLKFVWTFDGCVMVKKDENGDRIKLKELKDLEQF